MKSWILIAFSIFSFSIQAQYMVFETDTVSIDYTVMPPNDPPMFAVDFPINYTVNGTPSNITFSNYRFLNVEIPNTSFTNQVEFTIGAPGVYYSPGVLEGTTENLPGDYTFITAFFDTYFFEFPGITEQVSFTIEFSDEMDIPYDTITLSANLTLGTVNSGPPIIFDTDSAEVDISIQANSPFNLFDIPIGYSFVPHPYYPTVANYKFLEADIPAGATFDNLEFFIGEPIFYQSGLPQGSITVIDYFNEMISVSLDNLEFSGNNIGGKFSFTIEFSDEFGVPFDTINIALNVCLLDPILDLISYTPPTPFCPDTEITFTAPDGFASYAWTDGSSTPTATFAVGTSGFVDVGVTDNNGCMAMDMRIIDFDVPASQPLCFVTVDGDSGKNKLLWEKTTGQGTTMFNIYKQGVAANQYDLIKSQIFDDLSEFIDLDSNPLGQSEKYYLTAVNGCETEGEPAEPHKTVHLTSNVGINGEVNLIWEPYEGLQYATFNIYRGNDLNSLQLIAQRPSNTFTYTDFDAPADVLVYQIEIEAPEDCEPSRAESSIRSNLSEAATVGTNDLAKSGFAVFPNPSPASVQLKNIPISGVLMIHDAFGMLVHETVVQESEIKTMDLANISTGVYVISIKGIAGSMKFIKM